MLYPVMQFVSFQLIDCFREKLCLLYQSEEVQILTSNNEEFPSISTLLSSHINSDPIMTALWASIKKCDPIVENNIRSFKPCKLHNYKQWINNVKNHVNFTNYKRLLDNVKRNV